jgi:hypothetical protein
MIEEEDRSLVTIPFKGGEEITSAWRGLEELTGDGLGIKDLLKKFGSLYFIPRWIDCINPYVFLEVMNRFFKELIPVHVDSP